MAAPSIRHVQAVRVWAKPVLLVGVVSALAMVAGSGAAPGTAEPSVDGFAAWLGRSGVAALAAGSFADVRVT